MPEQLTLGLLVVTYRMTRRQLSVNIGGKIEIEGEVISVTGDDTSDFVVFGLHPATAWRTVKQNHVIKRKDLIPADSVTLNQTSPSKLLVVRSDARFHWDSKPRYAALYMR